MKDVAFSFFQFSSRNYIYYIKFYLTFAKLLKFKNKEHVESEKLFVLCESAFANVRDTLSYLECDCKGNAGVKGRELETVFCLGHTTFL